MPYSTRERPIQRVVGGVRGLRREDDIAMLLQMGSRDMIRLLDEARRPGNEVYLCHLSQLTQKLAVDVY